MLMRIAALEDRNEQERLLLEAARFLASDVLRDLVLGQGPMGIQNCAQLLEKSVKANQYDEVLAPIIARIETRAVTIAARKVIDGHGRVNYRSRFAAALMPGLTRLSIMELIRLKATGAWRDLQARFDF